MANPSPAAREAAKKLSKNNWLADRTSATEEFVAYLIEQQFAPERKAADEMVDCLLALALAAGDNRALWNEARRSVANYRRTRGEP